MSTMMKEGFGVTPSPSSTTPPSKDQLRRDRRTAILVVAIMATLMGLVIWLASMSGGSVPEGIDYWPMMP
ncbi:MAG: hypothetical protein ABI614_27715 [Planctomycetota bacterium]